MSDDATRRTTKTRTGGRAARVVESVLSAAAEELGRAGYAAMRVEDVATRAGVNKTTIYRRWPTKMALVTATLLAHVRGRERFDTGSLRGDLRASLLTPFNLTKAQQGLLRFVMQERALPEVEALARQLRQDIRAERVAMVKRAIVRGELPGGADARLIVELVSAPVQQALLFEESLGARSVERMLDIVLAGATAVARAKKRKKKAK